MAIALPAARVAVARVSMGYWQAVLWRLRRDPTTLAAGTLLLLIVLSAVLAPAIAPHDPNAGSLLKRLAPIGTPGYPLGTDEQGRDMLTRLLYGGRMTLTAGIAPVLVAFVAMMTLFPAAVIAFLLFHKRGEFRRAGIWILLAGVVAGWLPVVAWNAQHDWVSFRHVFRQVGANGGATSSLNWLGPVQFLGCQVGVMFGLWLVAYLAAAWRFRPARSRSTSAARP
jgi:hypothetical protein